MPIRPSSSICRSFKPFPMDMSEERRRIRKLASRKRAIGILGITETARQMMEQVAVAATTINQPAISNNNEQNNENL